MQLNKNNLAISTPTY